MRIKPLVGKAYQIRREIDTYNTRTAGRESGNRFASAASEIQHSFSLNVPEEVKRIFEWEGGIWRGVEIPMNIHAFDSGRAGFACATLNLRDLPGFVIGSHRLSLPFTPQPVQQRKNASLCELRPQAKTRVFQIATWCWSSTPGCLRSGCDRRLAVQ